MVRITAGSDAPTSTRVLLKLYIAGHTARSRKARRDMDTLCAASPVDLEVEVIDIVEQPQLAEDERILATPLVVRDAPPPPRRIIGDLSDLGRVLAGLDLVPELGGKGGVA